MKGRRLQDGFHYSDAEPGDYWKQGAPDSDMAFWSCCTPNGEFGNLDSHDVTENDDGTITVKPSILVRGGEEYHGWLTNGVWSDA